MAKQATDAEVMEYLWPTERPVQGGQPMNNPKITSLGIAAALLLFSALLFGERAEAGDLFPEGIYKSGDYRLSITAEGDYEKALVSTPSASSSGLALHEGEGVCREGAVGGNLWVVNSRGEGYCYTATVRANRLIIETIVDPMGRKVLGGIWVKQ